MKKFVLLFILAAAVVMAGCAKSNTEPGPVILTPAATVTLTAATLDTFTPTPPDTFTPTSVNTVTQTFTYTLTATDTAVDTSTSTEIPTQTDTTTFTVTVTSTITLTSTITPTFTITCTATLTRTCVAETCNGIDDDCDEVIDEGLSPPPCSNQQGVCAGAKQYCNGASGWIDCNAAAYLDNNANYQVPPETACDNKDNDCNGIIDDIPPGFRPLCAKQAGVCGGARKTCVSGVWIDCSDANYLAYNAAYQAGAETTCGDDLDNDCDGLADCTDGNCAGVGTCP